MSKSNKHLPRRAKKGVAKVAISYILLTLAALAAITPVAISIMGSFKSKQQFLSGTALDLPAPFTFENYIALFTQTDIPQALVITFGVVAITTVGQLLTSIMAAYAFAKLSFKGRELLFWVYLATMMIPAAVTFIPLFMLMSQAGLKNTFWGIVLPFAFVSPYAVFLLKQFFSGISSELIDAARLDGASHWRIIWQIMVPNARPIIATLAVITVVSHWNNFLWPLMISPLKNSRTLTVATAQLQSAFDGQWWLVTAATTLSVLPLIVLLVVFNKQIMRSITIGKI